MRPRMVDVVFSLAHALKPILNDVVVLDILRASTTIVAALKNGARCVAPFREVDAARAYHSLLPPGEALLAGERGGLPPAGFDLGNSPRDFTADKVTGKTICFSTTNGAAAIELSKHASRVFIGAIVNSRAVLNALEGESDIVFLCAGTDGLISAEDVLAAGWMVDELIKVYPDSRFELTDAAKLAMSASLHALAGGSLFDTPRVTQLLRESQGGRNLVALGLEQDIEDAARWNRCDLAPRLNADGLITV